MTNTRKMTIIAILSAVSFLLMYLKFPLIPTANFLEVDFSLVPILFGLLILDTKASFCYPFGSNLAQTDFKQSGAINHYWFTDEYRCHVNLYFSGGIFLEKRSDY